MWAHQTVDWCWLWNRVIQCWLHLRRNGQTAHNRLHINNWLNVTVFLRKYKCKCKCKWNCIYNAPYSQHSRYRGADGIPLWSPSQVPAANFCVCKCMCVRVTALSGIYYSGSCNYLPVNTADAAGYSKFDNVTQTILSPCVPAAGDWSDSRK